MATPRATRAPIAPTFRSGSPPEAGSQAPERPSTRMASSPNSPQTRIIASSSARTYATTSIGSRSLRIG